MRSLLFFSGTQKPLERNHFGSVWDVVVNPLCVVYLQSYATMGKIHPQPAIHDVERVLVISYGMEQVVAAELRVIVAAKAGTEHVPFGTNGELSKHCWRVPSSCCAGPVFLQLPVSLASPVNA